MKRFSLLLLLGCWSLSSRPAYAAETDAVVEIFACTLKPGKTMADFDAATKFWQTEMKKIGPAQQSYFGVVFTPIRANAPADVYWLGTHPNLNAWARGHAEYAASAGGQSADARFDAVSTCKSGLYFSKALREALPDEEGDVTAVAESYSCTLKPGKTMANVESALAVWNGQVEKLKAADSTAANFSAYMLTPWLANTPVDVLYLVISDDITTFGKVNTQWITSGLSAPSGAAFNDAHSCETGLYATRVVHEPTPPAAPTAAPAAPAAASQ